MDTERLMYDISTAAGQLGIGRTKLLEEVAAGRLRSVKIGTRRVVPRQALVSYIAILEEEAAAKASCLPTHPLTASATWFAISVPSASVSWQR